MNRILTFRYSDLETVIETLIRPYIERINEQHEDLLHFGLLIAVERRKDKQIKECLDLCLEHWLEEK